MNQVDATTSDGLWVVLKLEPMKAVTLEEDESAEEGEYKTATSAGWRLTVRADDKIDPDLLIAKVRRIVESAAGATPAAMQPFYVYGVVVFEWRERNTFDADALVASVREMVLNTNLKRRDEAGKTR